MPAEVPATRRAPHVRGWLRLRNAAFKQAFRLLHARSEAPNQRFWPDTTIGRAPDGAIERFRLGRCEIPLLAPRELAASAPRGESCDLIAAGPSIRAVDYARLSLQHPFALNGGIALAREAGVRFEYACITDTLFIRRRAGLVAEILARDLVFLTTPLCLWHLLQIFEPAAIRCRICLFDIVGHRAQQRPTGLADALAAGGAAFEIFDAERGLGFSRDPVQGLFPGGTIAYVALQIAVWLGFKTLRLHGVDIQGAASQGRFYETPDCALRTYLERDWPALIEPSFASAARLLRARGVQVFNLSPAGALRDLLEPFDWRALRTANTGVSPTTSPSSV